MLNLQSLIRWAAGKQALRAGLQNFIPESIKSVLLKRNGMKYLAIDIRKCICYFGCCLLISRAHAQTPPESSCYGINNMRSYLTRAASAITEDSSKSFSSLATWQKLRPERYKEFIEMMGLEHLPLTGKRSDLHITVTAVVQKDGYRIEKLYYQSLPGLYVCANLYVPDGITTPRPAILYLSGHAHDPKFTYQAHARKFAKLGFVCLILETIQFGEVPGVHWGCYKEGWFNWYSRGYNPGGAELWNGIRGIDLLTQRREVDPEKIGVTGISGGGAQSWYIAAIDPRVKAAAPVCGGGTLKDHILQRTVDGHCDCMMPINTFGRDFKDIGDLIAPRPLLICQANQDEMYSIESVRELESKLKTTYALYGQPQNIRLVESPGPHSYHKISREQIFSFFEDRLMGKQISPEKIGDIDSLPKDLASSSELRVFTKGVPKGDISATIQDHFIPLAPPPVIDSKKSLHDLKNSITAFLKTRTFGAFPQKETGFSPRIEIRSMGSKNAGSTIYSFVTEEGWRLKLEVHWKNDSSAKRPLLLVLRNPDNKRWRDEGFVSGFENKYNIAYFEARGIGETGWDPALQWHIRRAAAWTGRTIASMRVYDVLRCLQFCRTLSNIDSTRVNLAAQDEMGVVALYSALLDGHCDSVLLRNTPGSQDLASDPEGKGSAIEMLNCLKVTDVNRIPAMLWPTKTIFMGPMPAAYQWSDAILRKWENGSIGELHELTAADINSRPAGSLKWLMRAASVNSPGSVPGYTSLPDRGLQ